MASLSLFLGVWMMVIVIVAIRGENSCANLRPTDYCKMCKNHVVCAKLPSECSKYKRVKAIDYTKEWRDYFIQEINRLRASVADGSQKKHNLPPAARMGSMTWSRELACVVSYNLKQCKMSHDVCRPVDGSPMAGQNLAETCTTGPFHTEKQAIDFALSTWFSEIKDCNKNDVAKFDGSKTAKIGHFSQLVQDNGRQMGCGGMQYTRNGMNCTLMGCNYAGGNVINQSIYKSSTKAACECKTGPNPNHKALCSTKEIYG